jgi:hypothetical protein
MFQSCSLRVIVLAFGQTMTALAGVASVAVLVSLLTKGDKMADWTNAYQAGPGRLHRL